MNNFCLFVFLLTGVILYNNMLQKYKNLSNVDFKQKLRIEKTKFSNIYPNIIRTKQDIQELLDVTKNSGNYFTPQIKII